MRFRIEGIDVLYVKTLEIERKVNEHSYCKISFVVKEEFPIVINQYKNLIFQPFSLQAIEEDRSDKKVQNIFSGYVEEVKISKNFAENIITLECYSNSKKEDKDTHLNIFQNTEKSLGDILKQINFVSVAPTYLEENIENISFPLPVIQNDETNFEFMKRLLIKNKKVLIPESLLSNQRIWIGERKGNIYQLDSEYLEMSFQQDINKITVTLMNKYYELGDIIEVISEKYFIIENSIEFKEGVCYCNYVLIKEYSGIEAEENSLLDRKFLGEVIENKDDKFLGRIQVKFKEDKYINGNSNLYWFKVLTPYSTQDTGFYFIPSKGDKVIVEFIKDMEPIIVGSIRENGHENFKNPNELFIKNDFGKEIDIKEKEINIISLFDNIYLSLDEEKIEINNGDTGLYIEKEKITFQNKNNIVIIDDGITIKKVDGGEIKIKDSIELAVKNSKINLKENIDMLSSKQVNLNGNELNLHSQGNIELKGNNFKVETSNISIK